MGPGPLVANAAEEEFPPSVKFTHDGRERVLDLTGEAKRNFLVFKVYRMAHYLESGADPGAAEEIPLERIFSNEVAKQVTLRFLRDLPKEKIQNEMRKSILKNTKPEWLKTGATSLERFIKAIDRDVAKDDQFSIRCLPGGKTIAYYNEEESLVIDDPAFAKMLWSMWFGDKPVVRTADLVNRMESR